MISLRSALDAVDHLLLGVPDLESGIRFVAQRFGVEPVPGGRHPQLGTHNALAGLGGERYLEVIAPDPAPAAVASGLAPPFAWLARCSAPALATWAVRADDLAPIAAVLDRLGRAHSGLTEGSRRRPDGSLLSWQTLFLDDTEQGVLPFFIRWHDPLQHPSRRLNHRLLLADLRFEHPEPDRIAGILRALGCEAYVAAGRGPALEAAIRTIAR